MSDTKQFHIRVLLTITTSRLLTKGKDRGRLSPPDNGIGDLYDILGWMTNDSPMTHQLPRFANECKPWLLRWFPELAACGAQSALDSLDKWLKADRTGGSEAIEMWLAEQQMMFPELKLQYDVPRIPQDAHTQRDAIEELVEILGTEEGLVVVNVGDSQ